MGENFEEKPSFSHCLRGKKKKESQKTSSREGKRSKTRAPGGQDGRKERKIDFLEGKNKTGLKRMEKSPPIAKRRA